jgi:hypothetical protein
MTATLPPIGLVHHSELRFVYLRIAKRLNAECGAELHVFCNTPEVAAFYRKAARPGLFASIEITPNPLKESEQPVTDEAAVIAEARANEAWLGTPYNRLIMANRHFGRGFSPGGLYHSRSNYSERTSYVGVLSAYNRVIAAWERFIAAKRLGGFIGGTKIEARLAAANGMFYRALDHSRLKNRYLWVENEFMECPAVLERYAALEDGTVEMFDEQTQRDVVGRQEARRLHRLDHSLYRMAHSTAQRLYWIARGYEKARVGYLARDHILQHWRTYAQSRQVLRYATTPLPALAGRPFVFFPLHEEPESSLQVMAPEAINQLALINALARDLPAGTILAVKENIYALGRRPKEYYRQILEHKNVVMLDIHARGLDVIREAAAVATVTGTAGLEAAVMGKPVIAFGRHNMYAALPQVRVVHDVGDMVGLLREALEAGEPEGARRASRRFLQALIDESFDMRSFSYVHPNRVEADSVTDAFRGLMRSLARAALPSERPHSAPDAARRMTG